MKINQSETQRHSLSEQVVTHLNQITAQDLTSLTVFAARRLQRRAELNCPLPYHCGAADLVQEALLRVLQGCTSADSGRQPRSQDVRSKEEFLAYLGSVINSLIANQRKLPDAEDYLVTVLAAPEPSPAEQADFNDLTAQLLQKLSAKTLKQPALQAVVQTWRHTIQTESKVPSCGQYKRAYRVRQLAQEILRNLN